MKPRKIKPVVLPPQLARNTIGSLPVDSPRYILAADVLIREETDELFIDKSMLLNDKCNRPTIMWGRVGIMSAAIADPETNELFTGYVADLRYIENADKFCLATTLEPPDDQEERNNWEIERSYETPLAAVVAQRVEDHENEVWGDERFTSAALHLAGAADKLNEILDREERERKRAEAEQAKKQAKQQ